MGPIPSIAESPAYATQGRIAPGDMFPLDFQFGDEAVAIGHCSGVVADFDHQPIDGHRLLIAAQRHAGQPLIAADDPFLPVADAMDPFIEADAGAEFRNRLV
jgi:hypothetical protein